MRAIKFSRIIISIHNKALKSEILLAPHVYYRIAR